MLSLPLRYMELARAAQEAGSWTLRVLRDESLPIRLAVYHKLLGASDDTYPDAWLDPAAKPARMTIRAPLVTPAWKFEITGIALAPPAG